MNRCRILISLALCAVWHAGPTLGQSQIDMNVLTRLDNLEKQVSRQKDQLEVQTNLIADLQARVSVQESAIAQQHAVINEQQTTIVNQQKMMSEQQDELHKQQSNLSAHRRRLTRLEGILMAHRTNKGNRTRPTMNTGAAKSGHQEGVNNTFHMHTEPVAEENDGTKSQEPGATNVIRSLNKRLVLESGSPVAFHAVNTAAENAHVGLHQNILFPKVMLNLGAGFHNQYGVFTAPAPGLYIFSTSIMSYVNTHAEIQASVLKNGDVLAIVFAHGDSGSHDQGSVTVVTQLAVGDEVWVSDRYPADASYFGGYFTSFTGCLLWPM